MQSWAGQQEKTSQQGSFLMDERKSCCPARDAVGKPWGPGRSVFISRRTATEGRGRVLIRVVGVRTISPKAKCYMCGTQQGIQQRG